MYDPFQTWQEHESRVIRSQVASSDSENTQDTVGTQWDPTWRQGCPGKYIFPPTNTQQMPHGMETASVLYHVLLVQLYFIKLYRIYMLNNLQTIKLGTGSRWCVSELVTDTHLLTLSHLLCWWHKGRRWTPVDNLYFYVTTQIQEYVGYYYWHSCHITPQRPPY